MRVKTGPQSRKHHKKILSANEGYRLTYSKTYKRAHEAFVHAGQYAYNHRRKRKGQMRSLWIVRVNAGLRALGFTYKNFVNKAKEISFAVDRKILADMAIKQPEAFEMAVKKVME